MLRWLVTFAALLAAGLLPACSAPPAGSGEPTAATSAPRSVPVLSEQADTLADRGDYAAAAALYREALRIDPAHLGIRYRLGSALSHLERFDETAEQFQWVVAHGEPSTPEVALAAEWLRAIEPATPATEKPTRPVRPVGDQPATDDRPAKDTTGTVRGQTRWSGLDPTDFKFTLQILLEREDDPSARALRSARTQLGAPYVIDRVPPGTWRLSAQVGTVRLWETTVEVRAGKVAVVDLTPDTSLVSPAEFPAQGS